MGDFKPCYQRPIGPIQLVPIQYKYAPSLYGNMGTYTRCIELTSGQITEGAILDVENLGTPWSSTDDDFITDGGYPLYYTDGLGGKGEYSGYDILWQHKVTNVIRSSDSENRIIQYNLTSRIVKKALLDPLDITVIGSTRSNYFGGTVNAITNLKIGYTAFEGVSGNYEWLGFGYTGQWHNSQNGKNYGGFYLMAIREDWFDLNNFYDPVKIIEDPNEQDPGGESGEGGGDGGFNRDSDSNPVPGLPEINATDAGFVKLYYVTDEVLHLIAAEVYSSNFFDWLKDFLMKPTDLICGIAIVPFIPSLGVRGTHSFGTFSFSTVLTSIASQYKVINCGSINIEKYYGSCFDYSPYTVLQIFLPFIGMRELDVDEVMGRSISVVYHCDCYTGACVAFITTPINNVDSVIAQYSGNILQQVPYGAGDFSQIVAATLSVATAVTGSIAAGGAAGAALAKEGATAGKIVSGAAAAAGENAPSITSSMSNVMSLKPRIEKASIAAGSSGQMSTLKPYLLRRIPRQSLPANYKTLNGYPSNIAGPLSNFSGYAEIETIQLSGVNLTEPEITELLTILRGGVII